MSVDIGSSQLSSLASPPRESSYHGGQRWAAPGKRRERTPPRGPTKLKDNGSIGFKEYGPYLLRFGGCWASSVSLSLFLAANDRVCSVASGVVRPKIRYGQVVASDSCGEPWQPFVASGRASPRSDVVTFRRHAQLDRSMEERSDTKDTTVSAAPSSAPACETSTAHIIRAASSGCPLSYRCARRGQRRRVSPPGDWWVPRHSRHLG